MLPAAAAEEAERLLAAGVLLQLRDEVASQVDLGRQRGRQVEAALQPVRRGDLLEELLDVGRARRLEQLLLEGGSRVRHVGMRGGWHLRSPGSACDVEERAHLRRIAHATVAREHAVEGRVAGVDVQAGGSSACSLSSPATITIDSGPARRITSALICWLPRPNSEPWPPTMPDHDRRRPVASHGEQVLLVRVAHEQRAVEHDVDAEQACRRARAGRGSAPVVVPGPRMKRPPRRISSASSAQTATSAAGLEASELLLAESTRPCPIGTRRVPSGDPRAGRLPARRPRWSATSPSRSALSVGRHEVAERGLGRSLRARGEHARAHLHARRGCRAPAPGRRPPRGCRAPCRRRRRTAAGRRPRVPWLVRRGASHGPSSLVDGLADEPRTSSARAAARSAPIAPGAARTCSAERRGAGAPARGRRGRETRDRAQLERPALHICSVGALQPDASSEPGDRVHDQAEPAKGLDGGHRSGLARELVGDLVRGRADDVGDRVDLRLGDHERRRERDRVRRRQRACDDPALEARARHARADLAGRVERAQRILRLATNSTAAISPSPRTSPTSGWSPTAARSRCCRYAPRAAGLCDEALLLDQVEVRHRRRGGDRVRGVGVAVAERAGAACRRPARARPARRRARPRAARRRTSCPSRP